MTQIRLLIVEDHSILAETLGVALGAEGFDVLVADQIDAEAILENSRSFRPDVVLLDLDLGQRVSGQSLIGPLREVGAHVLIVTGTLSDERQAEGVEAGAVGVVRKSAPFAELVDAIRSASEGRPVTSERTRDEMLESLRTSRALRRDRDERFDRLSPRERDVLSALMDGKAAEAIAAEQFVSVATVRTQIRAILLKLGVSSQLAAVALAREAGWTNG